MAFVILLHLKVPQNVLKSGRRCAGPVEVLGLVRALLP